MLLTLTNPTFTYLINFLGLVVNIYLIQHLLSHYMRTHGPCCKSYRLLKKTCLRNKCIEVLQASCQMYLRGRVRSWEGLIDSVWESKQYPEKWTKVWQSLIHSCNCKQNSMDGVLGSDHCKDRQSPGGSCSHRMPFGCIYTFCLPLDQGSSQRTYRAALEVIECMPATEGNWKHVNKKLENIYTASQ